MRRKCVLIGYFRKRGDYIRFNGVTGVGQPAGMGHDPLAVVFLIVK
jgi:hypothetical protein